MQPAFYPVAQLAFVFIRLRHWQKINYEKKYPVALLAKN